MNYPQFIFDLRGGVTSIHHCFSRWLTVYFDSCFPTRTYFLKLNEINIKIAAPTIDVQCTGDNITVEHSVTRKTSYDKH